jgi:exonuclease SbcC
MNQLEESKEAGKKNLEELAGILAALKTKGEEKKGQAEEKDKSIKKRVGEISDLQAYKLQLVNEIENIQTLFSKLEKEKIIIEEKYNKCVGELTAQKTELKKAEVRSEEEKKKLRAALTAAGYVSAEEAEGFLITEEEINALKTELQDYENKLLEINAKIQEVNNKLAGRNITEQQWEEIKLLKEEKEAELKAAREAVVRANTELDGLKKKLAELKDVLAAKEKLEHKLSLLNDLDNLFKGKRFVEFVAIHQLKYISLEASKRLKEITSGNYGLEVDEEGKFIIRDYKNGGAARDASTLSGGETFLASLSLALALSAQIQLKGTAPLELFFLDEGFGTLDDNLLDVVMNSLESIYNERLSVGIISHVESIKNRMPVKLIVTPAAAGIGGSRVTLEK